MRSFLIVLLIVASFGLYSQVTLQPVVPAVGVIQKAQLWNLVAVNNSDKQISCHIRKRVSTHW